MIFISLITLASERALESALDTLVPTRMSELTVTPKSRKLNEAGDRVSASLPVPLPVEGLSSHNGDLEEIDHLPEVEVTRQLLELNLENDVYDPQPVLSRSDLSSNWRKAMITVPEATLQPILPKGSFVSRLPSMPGSRKPLTLSGPDEEKIAKLVAKTGYSLSVSARQRSYGPPPDWSAPVPGKECQVFVGKIPKQIFEDELVPLFERAGKIYELRLMMEGPPSVISRGFGFVVYATAADARRAESMLDNFEIIPGYHIVVAVSEPICRLFISQIPRHLTESQVEREIESKFKDVTSIEHKQTKGYCFVTFSDHMSTALAKKQLCNGSVRLFGTRVSVDFADQIPEPDEKLMSEVKSVHVSGFRESVTEQELHRLFQSCGRIEKVKKLPLYAFVHFKERSSALEAIEKIHNQEFQGTRIQVKLARPPVDPAVKAEAVARRAKRLENQKKGMTGDSLSRIANLATGRLLPDIQSE